LFAHVALNCVFLNIKSKPKTMRKIFTLVLILMAAFIRSNGQGLVINEVDYDQPGTDSSEFIELYNSGSTPIDLNIFAIILYNGNAAGSVYDSFPLPNQTLNAGDYFVISAGTGTVPNTDMVHLPASNMIQNGSPDAIAIQSLLNGTIVDAVSYEGNVSPPYIEGNGVPLAQSDTGNTPYVGMGRFPDGADTQDDSTDFHRACITPGAANVNTSTGCQNPLSVVNMTVKNSMIVYPNPSKGIVNINFNGLSLKNASVIVSDILGNELKKIALKNSESQQINIAEFQDGIYFVKIKSDSGELSQRVILKK
jgi:hypothetical protein